MGVTYINELWKAENKLERQKAHAQQTNDLLDNLRAEGCSDRILKSYTAKLDRQIRAYQDTESVIKVLRGLHPDDILADYDAAKPRR